MPTINEAYEGSSGAHWRRCTSHRYVIEVGADTVTYLALSGSIRGQIRTIKRKTWDSWVSQRVAKSNYPSRWEAIIASLMPNACGIDDRAVTEDTSGKLQISLAGRQQTIILGGDIEAGMTLVYGENRYLAITDTERVMLVDLNDFSLCPHMNVMYLLAKGKLTLTV